jgi:uncharacterized membrane protein
MIMIMMMMIVMIMRTLLVFNSTLCLPASYQLVSCLPVIIGILHDDDDDVYSVCIQHVVPNDDINV